MTECDREKVKAINAQLKELLLRRMDKPGVLATGISGLNLVRREASNSSERCFGRPLASIIVQGGKRSVIGTREYELRENQRLVSGVDMPSSSYAVDPTPENPFLSLFFHLDKQMLTELVTEMEPESDPSGENGLCVSVADAEPEFMESVLRLVELLDKPNQIAVRAPIIMRELHYLLLVSPQGGVLRGLYSQGSQNGRVIRAVSLLRKNIVSPFRVEDLARQVNMSKSSLHRHFKIVTGFSPLQYHKRLRLYEAQRLMLTRNESASGAAMAVGYESVTQFSREYKRMFGEPPHRDINRRRGHVL